MKKSKYILLMVLIVGFVLPMNIEKINAASFSISGPSSVSPGQSFSITVNVSGGEGSFSVSASGGASVTGKNPVWSNESTTITAPSSGTFTVTVSCATFADDNAASMDLGSKSKNITVTTPSTGGETTTPNNKPSTNTPETTPVEDTKSKDTSLASLTISKGTISPAFNKDVVEYSVNLDSKTTKVNIGATTTDAKATVSGIGEKAVVPGENVFEVIVTAENKSTKKYTVKAIVDETPTVFLEQGTQKLGIVKNLTGVTVPAGFEETMVTINGEDVKAWTNGNMNKTILYMINENNEKSFYLYENAKITSVFKPVALLGRNVYIVDIARDKQTIEGMKYQEVTVDGNVMMGWAFKDKAFVNYFLISVMNEKGDMVYYQYESSENTMQLYSNSAPVTMDTYQSAKKYETYTIVAVVVATILAGATGIVAMFCIKYKKANRTIVDMVTRKNKD